MDNEMKTLILNGSPHKNGDSMAIVSQMCQFLQGEVKIISAYELNISACTDCRYCREHKKCAIQDDMGEVYEYLDVADNLIISSPIHLYSLSAPLLALLSRLYYLHRHYRNSQRSIKKKNGIYVLTGNGYNYSSEHEEGQESFSNAAKLVGGNVKKIFRGESDMKTSAKDAAAAMSSWSGGISETFSDLNMSNTRYVEQFIKVIFSRLNTRLLGDVKNTSTAHTPAADNPITMGEAKSMAELLNRFYDEQVKKEGEKQEQTRVPISDAEELAQWVKDRIKKVVSGQEQKGKARVEKAADELEFKGKAPAEVKMYKKEQDEKVRPKKELTGQAQRDKIRMEKEAQKERARYIKKQGL